MRGALGAGLCCLGLQLLTGAAFNLDGTHTLLKDGPGGSLFGFSVALHRQLRPEPASWMLVGAPQAAALPGQRANRTGGLYACPLTLAGNLRVELFNQSSLELGTYDDGPYEAGGEKDQDPSLIPVPANSYFDPGERLPGTVGDVAQNSYLGMQMARIQLWEGIFPGSLALVPGGAQTHLLSCSGPIPVPTDLAVGAPFDGAGKVYIYHGSSLGIVTKPVDVQACFSYTASPDSYSPRLMLAYTLDADVDRRKRGQAPRVAFLDGKTADPEHQFTDVVELPHQHAPVCVKATFQLQDSIRDKLRPITVELTYSIKRARSKRQSQGSALPPLVPVLNALQPSSQRAAMSDQKFVALEIQVTNLPSDPAVPHQDGDDAHEALLTVTFPEALPYAGIRSHESWALPGLEKQPCLPNLNASQVQCELGNPMKRGAQVRFYLIASTSGITIETRELELELTLSTLADPRQLFFGGRVLGESAMRSEGQVGSAVRFEVTARSLVFQCPLYSCDRSAVLTAWGRLWNSTFLEATSLDPREVVAWGVPWWIILIAVLAGMLVLGLLVSILWKLGFFKRTRYQPAAVPQYHAVKIPREERQQFHEEKTGTIQKKEWVTDWSEGSDGHVPISA
nr:integrin alpha-7 [Pelodiscus sinensis]|eukprot:XP_025044484.1 integrin alpha-7 [Pelodiscus sinensis]